MHLPVLTWFGEEEDACDVVLNVQNAGDDVTKVMLLMWDAPGGDGPFHVECSGPIPPGSAWSFRGPGAPGTVPSGALKGIVFSLSAEQVPGDGDLIADAVCQAASTDM